MLSHTARGKAALAAISIGSGFQRQLVAVAIGLPALLLLSAGPAGAQTVPPAPPCNTISGTTGSIVTCSGNLSTGIDLANASGPYSVLNVNNLTADIVPAAGITGISFTSNGPVELNISPGSFAIHAADADGVFAATNSGTVTIISSADVFTTGSGAIGIQASGQDDLLTVTSSGNISTTGNNGFGIAAGTVYGDVIVNSTGKITTAGTFAAGINVGTIGSVGTMLGSITIFSSGDIKTAGNSAIGINAATVYGPIDVESLSDITGTGFDSVGINAQTNGEIRINSQGNIAVVGRGISAEASGGVSIISSGDIATQGDGGMGIYVEAAATATVLAGGSIVTRGDGAAGIAAAGQDGTIVMSSANVTTSGASAAGIAVETTGDAGVLTFGSIRTSGNNSRGVSVTGFGNGTVAVGASGTITTSGNDSDGIWVESDSGLVAIMNAANITTTGEDADGISAVSGPSGGTPNDVMIMNAGVISATGLYSAGIRAEGRDVSVDNFGTVIGGDCCGAVMLGATGQAVVMNYGTIIGQTTGEALFATGGDVRVENFGTVTGNVFLAAANTSNFFNHAGALFNSGEQVIAGSVVNDGTIAPGGRGAVLMTMMADNYTQGAGGIYAVDLDPASSGDRNDQIVVSNAADVGGIVEVRMLSLPLTEVETFTILTGMGGLTDNGLSLVASPALHATLISDATDVVLGIAVDYDVNGLGGNQRSIARYLNRVLGAGAGAAGPVLLGLLNVGNFGEYANALDQLSPAVYSNAEIAALYSSLAFSNSLLSCKVNGTDTASIIREGQCLWAGASARFLNTSTTSEQIGSNETAGLFTAGAQVALDNVWRLGVAGGFQSSTLQTATGATSEGSLGQAGVSLKYNPGPLLLAAAITGGGAKYDTRRVMSFGGFTGAAESDQTLGIFSGAARAAYVLGSPQLYAKPTFDISVTQLQLGSFTETGSAAALAVEGGGQTVFAAAPSVEVGTEFWLGNGTLVRPLIRLGGVFYSGNDLALTAGFANLGPLNSIPGGPGFTITTDADDAMGLAGAGLDVINGNDAVLRLSYDGQLGETTQIHAVGIKGSARF